MVPNTSTNSQANKLYTSTGPGSVIQVIILTTTCATQHATIINPTLTSVAVAATAYKLYDTRSRPTPAKSR